MVNIQHLCQFFISPKFAQILKYFAQSGDCTIAAYRNYASSTPQKKHFPILEPLMKCNNQG